MIDEVIIADHAFFHKNGCLYDCDQCKNFEYKCIINNVLHCAQDISFVYFKNKIVHRDDGPAVKWNFGTKFWVNSGAFHREDGPAIEYNDRPVKWWYRGKFIGDSYDGFTELDFSTWKKFKAFI